jgi:hypothetical protein
MKRSLTAVLFVCTVLLANAQAPFSMMYSGGYNHLAALPDGRFVFSGPEHNVMCIDSLGAVLWSQQAGNIGGVQGFLDVAPSGDGGAVLLTATDGTGSLQPTVIKVNSDGTTGWAMVVQCADTDVVVGSMARTTLGSTVVLVEELNGSPVGMRNLISLSPLGEVQWMMRYDTTQVNNAPARVLPGPDGGVLLLVGSGQVVKVSATGQVVWARWYNNSIDGAQVLPSGNIALHIRPYELAQGLLIIDPSGWLVSSNTVTSDLTFFGAFQRTPSGALVVGLSTYANKMQVMAMDTAAQVSSNMISTAGTVFDGGVDMDVLPDGRIAMLSNSGGVWTYFFRSDAALDPGTCFEPYVSSFETPLINAYVAQFLLEPAPYGTTTMVPCGSTGLADQGAPTLEVFPVPAHGDRLYVRNTPTAGFRYRIADVQGRAVLGGACQSAEAGIDVSSLAPGAYTLAIRSRATEQRIRFAR